MFDFALVGVGPECYVGGVSIDVFDRVSLFALLKWLVRPSFEDEMGSGAFKSMHHRHEFVSKSVATEMTDAFRFTAALGILDRTAEFPFSRAYIRRFLVSRALGLKRMAESDAWQQFDIGA